jgi:PAS domain S-box-containing protein
MSDHPSRPILSWRFLGYAVVTLGVLGLLIVSMGATLLVSAHQFLEETRWNWTRDRRESVLSLERHLLFGDPADGEAFREALARPGRVGDAIRFALDNPGDADRLRPYLEEALDTPEEVEGIYRFARWFGSHERTLSFLELSVQADDVLQEMEALARNAEATGLPGALGDPAREEALREALDEARTLDREAEALTAAIGVLIQEWSSDLQALIRLLLILASLVVLAVGLMLVRGAARRVSRSEAAVRESEATLAQVTAAIRDVFWLTPPDKSEMLYVSPAYEEIWGRAVEALYRDPSQWLQAVHPSDRERVVKALPLQESGEYDMEYRIQTPDGLVRWVHDRAFPVRNENGDVIRVAGVAEDITQRREMEEEVLRGRSLRVLARLAATVAHHFNNHLTVILGQVELLREERPDDSRLVDDLAVVEEAATRARKLTRSLLSMAREQPLVPRSVDLAEAVRDSARAAGSLLPDATEVTLDLAPSVVGWADPSYLREVLLEVAVLARDHLPQEGRVTIRTRNVELAKPVETGGRTLGPGEYVSLELEHSEGAISDPVLLQLLNPFEAEVEEVGPDQAGMGLASLRGFAEQSGGGLKVENLEGKGVLLTIFLPRARPEPSPSDRE